MEIAIVCIYHIIIIIIIISRLRHWRKFLGRNSTGESFDKFQKLDGKIIFCSDRIMLKLYSESWEECRAYMRGIKGLYERRTLHSPSYIQWHPEIKTVGKLRQLQHQIIDVYRNFLKISAVEF